MCYWSCAFLSFLFYINKTCKELYDLGNSESGVYRIEPTSSPGTVFDVYCNMTDGGWTYLQHRFTGALNFTRSYNEYVNGFGSVDGEFWLGLEKMYLLASTPRSVQLDMLTVEGDWYHLRYSDFSLGSASQFYKLSVSTYVSGYCTSGGLLYNNWEEFYAYDRDSTNGCADMRQFGWWFDFCTYVSINGKYGMLNSEAGFIEHCSGYKNLVASVMRIQLSTGNCEI